MYNAMPAQGSNAWDSGRTQLCPILGKEARRRPGRKRRLQRVARLLRGINPVLEDARLLGAREREQRMEVPRVALLMEEAELTT